MSGFFCTELLCVTGKIVWCFTSFSPIEKRRKILITPCQTQKKDNAAERLASLQEIRKKNVYRRKWKWKFLSRVNSLRPHGLYSPWNSPAQNTGMGSLSLLQGIFPTHGSNPGLPHCGWILYHLSHKGSPRILGWVPIPFSRGSSQPRKLTGVPYITGGFFTN